MITNTISVIEVIWTVLTLVGLCFNTRQFIRGVSDYRFVKAHRINHLREYAATTTAYMFGTWVVVQAMFVLIGVIEMTLPTTTTQTGRTMQDVVAACFILVSVVLAIGGYVIDKRRIALITKIAVEELAEKG